MFSGVLALTHCMVEHVCFGLSHNVRKSMAVNLYYGILNKTNDENHNNKMFEFEKAVLET